MPAPPELLEDLAGQKKPGIAETPGLLAFPHHWQVPAATEKAAYEAVLAQGGLPNCTYLGIPWATLTDGLRNRADVTWEMLRALNTMWRHSGTAAPHGRIVTVAQHIHADKFISFFRALGVTDLFWTHAVTASPEIAGIRVHPFPLFPAQTPNGPEPGDLHRPRRWLANFIGAYNPSIYLTDVRQHIFADEGRAEDLHIVRRNAWHFDRAVYAEQMKGITPDKARLALEARHKEEYLQAIRDSAFTLCPTGSGPNSIRIGEALALGSIPIVLTRDLALPGDKALWEKACLIEDDSNEGYRRALEKARGLGPEELRRKQLATQELYGMVGPENWARLLAGALSQ